VADEVSEIVFNENARWTSGEALTKALIQLTKEKLPDYMIPSIRLVERIPLTSNGKVDKKAVMQLPGLIAEERIEYVAPTTEIEKQLVNLWEEVLEKSPVGIRDNFFELGGHSLRATKLVSRIHQARSVNVELGMIFQHPTVEGLSPFLTSISQNGIQIIPVAPLQAYFDLSHAQRRLWVLNQFAESRIAYNVPSAYVFEGVVDLDGLEKSFLKLIERHESLRTVFVSIEGFPKQKIQRVEDFPFT
jgi:hypothetical protein